MKAQISNAARSPLSWGMVSLAALIAAVLIPSLVQAAQARSESVEGLARGSDLVVRGRVGRVFARFSDDGKRIFTFAELRPAAVFKGDVVDRVTMLVPGGVVGRIGQRVSGAPTFDESEEVVVFLRRAERGTFRVTGLAQGKFRVEGGIARPDLSGMTVVPSAQGEGERQVEAMPVDELARRVRGAGQ